MGTCAGPQDCYLVLRGIKTLALRMEEHNRNALAIARWLQAQPQVRPKRCIPAWNRTPSTSWHKRQMSGFGGTFSFRLKGGQDAVFNSRTPSAFSPWPNPSEAWNRSSSTP